MKLHKYLVSSALLCTVSSFSFAEKFTLSSTDISHGKTMTQAQEYAGFGCTGKNLSPQLSWTGAPKDTKAFALLVHDPDAPTGSGWWHWQLVNIPAETNALATGAGTANSGKLPKGTRVMRNDYGSYDFGGACPPEGHGVHRYRFKLFALNKALELPENPSAALVGYMVQANALAVAELESLYER